MYLDLVDRILELDAMPPAGSVFGYSRFVWMSQTNVPVVLFDPGINGMASMPNILEVVRKTCLLGASCGHLQ
jgi:hypothetical protein